MDQDYSFGSRFHGVLDGAGEVGAATNPEELLAAAHAACFSMALSLNLSEHGHPPQTIETQAHVHLRSGGIPAITRINLLTQAKVPGLTQPGLKKSADEAKPAASCPAR